MATLPALAKSFGPVLVGYHEELDREIASMRNIEFVLDLIHHDHEGALDETVMALSAHTVQLFHQLHDLHRALNGLQKKTVILGELLETISRQMTEKF